MHRILGYASLIGLFLFVLPACTSLRHSHDLDRNHIPEARSNVSVTSSEIRELAFQQISSEAGHVDLHLRGQLYTKNEGGQISPCINCTVTLSSSVDTSFKANMMTSAGGYFEIHTRVSHINVLINNPGWNPIVLENIETQSGGITTIRLINARGGEPERFRITKNGSAYAWTKLPY